MTQETQLTQASTCCGNNETCETSNETTVRETVENSVRVRPSVDIVDSGDAVVLVADVPGADDSTVELTVEKGVLTLKAESARVAEKWVRDPDAVRTRTYERTFRVSDDIDATSATASVDNGVLTVRLPKRAEAQPTKIAVRKAS